MSVTVTCSVHPKYKAIRKPTADCPQCWKIWELVDYLKQYGIF